MVVLKDFEDGNIPNGFEILYSVYKGNEKGFHCFFNSETKECFDVHYEKGTPMYFD